MFAFLLYWLRKHLIEEIFDWDAWYDFT